MNFTLQQLHVRSWLFSWLTNSSLDGNTSSHSTHGHTFFSTDLRVRFEALGSLVSVFISFSASSFTSLTMTTLESTITFSSSTSCFSSKWVAISVFVSNIMLQVLHSRPHSWSLNRASDVKHIPHSLQTPRILWTLWCLAAAAGLSVEKLQACNNNILAYSYSTCKILS